MLSTLCNAIWRHWASMGYLADYKLCPHLVWIQNTLLHRWCKYVSERFIFANSCQSFVVIMSAISLLRNIISVGNTKLSIKRKLYMVSFILIIFERRKSLSHWSYFTEIYIIGIIPIGNIGIMYIDIYNLLSICKASHATNDVSKLQIYLHDNQL